MAEFDIASARALGNGKLAERAVTDSALAGGLGSYKGRIAGSYRALLPDDIGTLLAGALVSTKIDGELWFLILDGKDVWLVNPRGTVIAGDIPLLKDAGKLAAKLKGRLILAGELHVKVDGHRCRVGDLVSALGGEAKADVARLCFGAFDLLPDDSQPISAYADRLQHMRESIPGNERLWVVETWEAATAADVQKLYEEQVVASGNEGLVVRTRDGLIYKVKPTHTIDAVVLGYTVKADAADSVRSLLLGLVREDGTTQVWGACGNLGSDADRKALFGRLAPLKVASHFRYASDSGGLYSFVTPAIVVEIKVTDLQAEKSDGGPVKSMALQFDGQAWNPVGLMHSASPLHPVLIRVRDDKKADAVDARQTQINDWLLPALHSDTVGGLPKSTLMRREVWKKDAKGKVAVRKLLVWKTNKEANPAFPAYVVHWTDYSAGRGTPLDREVRLAMEESVAMQIADAMVTDNIKKGWEKVT
jgi:hypothetical protein